MRLLSVVQIIERLSLSPTYRVIVSSDIISMPDGFRRHLVDKTLAKISATVISLKYALLASW